MEQSFQGPKFHRRSSLPPLIFLLVPVLDFSVLALPQLLSDFHLESIDFGFGGARGARAPIVLRTIYLRH